MSERAYAGFWLRTGAALIDTALIMLFIGPVLTARVMALVCSEDVGPVLAPMCNPGTGMLGVMASGLSGIIITYVLPAIVVVLFWVYRSATPGKIILGLKIIDARTGGKPSVAQLVVRYLGYYVSTVPLLLGLIWVGIDARKQGWHDKMASTAVVVDRSAERD